jgi:RecB family endonuclease NucS
MIVYGFLSYHEGHVCIPNKELMNQFQDVLLKETSLGYIHQLAQKSEMMLKATLEGDEQTVVEILEYAHNTETPLLSYNNESELTTIVSLVYLYARDFYRIEREDKAGIGYVDFIFYPEVDKKADCIILELKVNHTAKEAIQQIKDRQYTLKFEGRLGEKPKYTGRIIGVGIAYDKITKRHECEIEVLRENV